MHTFSKNKKSWCLLFLALSLTTNVCFAAVPLQNLNAQIQATKLFGVMSGANSKNAYYLKNINSNLENISIIPNQDLGYTGTFNSLLASADNDQTLKIFTRVDSFPENRTQNLCIYKDKFQE